MNTPYNQRPRWGWRVIILTILLIVLLLTSYWMVNKKQTQQVKNSDVVSSTAVIVEKDDEKDIIYQKMEKLIECESSGNPLAINVKDADGTASLGLCSMKIETFKEYTVKYGLMGENVSWNWVITMMFDEKFHKKVCYEILKNEKPEIIRNRLFPACARKIGL
jgi:hypothetical protein